MNKEILISFIIPIYNTEPDKVDRCINSIKKTKNLSIEILMIDDGSRKKYSRYYKKIASKYNVNYYYKINGGVSSARNFGMFKSRGKYLYFVDSDDNFVPKSIDSINNYMKADIVIFNIQIMKKRKVEKIGFSNKQEGYVKKEDLYFYALKDGLMNWVWGKMYRKNFIQKNKILFDTNKITGEDFDFVLKCIDKSRYIYYLPIVSYIYKPVINTSLHRSKTNYKVVIKNSWSLYLTRFKLLKKLCKKSNIEFSKFDKELEEDLIHNLFNVVLLNIDSKTALNTSLQDSRKLITNIHYYHDFNFITKIRLFMLNKNKKLYWEFYRILYVIYIMLSNNRSK